MKSYYFLFFISTFAIISCQSNKSIVKSSEREINLSKIENQLHTKDFRAFFDIASPLDNRTVTKNQLIRPGGTADRIPLTGSEYIEVKDDSIYMALSYFGTFLIGANYMPQAAREYRVKNELLSYERSFHEKKKYHEVKMKLMNSRETLTLNLKLYSNRKAILTVNSNHRTAISYYGYLDKKLK